MIASNVGATASRREWSRPDAAMRLGLDPATCALTARCLYHVGSETRREPVQNM
jgi:hypothetical protein